MTEDERRKTTDKGIHTADDRRKTKSEGSMTGDEILMSEGSDGRLQTMTRDWIQWPKEEVRKTMGDDAPASG
jgi:hypothetical protein